MEKVIDRGARNLSRVFFGVVIGLTIFYSYLAWRSLTWSPMFYIKYTDSERSKVVFSEEEPPQVTPVETTVRRGKQVYLSSGCALCHGIAGKGNVKNPNYIKDTSPALNTLAEKMFLYDREDVQTVLTVLGSGKSLTEVDELDVPRASAVIAQYDSVRKVILTGNPGGKKDPQGKPPFDMPAWKQKLSEMQINDIIAYLLNLYPWEEEK